MNGTEGSSQEAVSSLHTPGPWTLIGLDDEDWHAGNIVAKKKIKTFSRLEEREIARVDQDAYVGREDDEDNETRANARLVAAAPDLYEVCLRLVKWDKDHPKSTVHPMSAEGLHDQIIEAAKAAISKAEWRPA
mgnify:CR=1 FL=1